MNKLIFCLLLLVAVGFAADAHADGIPVGILSFDNLLPPSAGSPGTNEFTIGNFSGAYALDPDFPAMNDLTFLSSTLTVNFADGTTVSFALGDLGPGFLQDPNTGASPLELQYPDTTLINSATFTATIAPATILYSNGTSVPISTSLSALLLPSSGTTLQAGTDFVVLTATPAPEPGTLVLLGLGMGALAAGGKMRARVR